MLKIAHPIMQAPIGSAATPELAAAVAEAGGLGSLALTQAKRELGWELRYPTWREGFKELTTGAPRALARR